MVEVRQIPIPLSEFVVAGPAVVIISSESV